MKPNPFSQRMTEAEKAAITLELAKITQDRVDKMESIEWRILLSFWIGIAAFTGFTAGKICADESIFWVYVVLWLIFSFGWTPRNWRNRATTANLRNFYVRQTEKLARLRPSIQDEDPDTSHFGFLVNPIRTLQIATSAVFLYLSFLVLTQLQTSNCA